MTPRAKHAGRKIKCPDCDTLNPIPTVDEIQKAQRDKEMLFGVSKPKEHEPYKLSAPVERVEPSIGFFQVQQQIRREKTPDPPESVFFSGVFDFPWRHRGVMSRWGWLSLGISVLGLMWAASFWLYTEYGSAGVLGMAFLMLAEMYVAAWCASAAASCVFSIVQDTACGMDEVESWPENSWRDWMVDVLKIAVIFFTSGLISFLIAYPIWKATGVLSPVVFPIHALLFPVALLAGMDGESIWFPWSPLILRSLRDVTTTWLMFYVLTAVLTFAVMLLLVPPLIYVPFVAGAVSGPVLAAAIFIYARLLGRVAWKIGEEASKGPDLEL